MKRFALIPVLLSLFCLSTVQAGRETGNGTFVKYERSVHLFQRSSQVLVGLMERLEKSYKRYPLCHHFKATEICKNKRYRELRLAWFSILKESVTFENIVQKPNQTRIVDGRSLNLDYSCRFRDKVRCEERRIIIYKPYYARFRNISRITFDLLRKVMTRFLHEASHNWGFSELESERFSKSFLKFLNYGDWESKRRDKYKEKIRILNFKVLTDLETRARFAGKRFDDQTMRAMLVKKFKEAAKKLKNRRVPSIFFLSVARAAEFDSAFDHDFLGNQEAKLFYLNYIKFLRTVYTLELEEFTFFSYYVSYKLEKFMRTVYYEPYYRDDTRVSHSYDDYSEDYDYQRIQSYGVRRVVEWVYNYQQWSQRGTLVKKNVFSPRNFAYTQMRFLDAYKTVGKRQYYLKVARRMMTHIARDLRLFYIPSCLLKESTDLNQRCVDKKENPYQYVIADFYEQAKRLKAYSNGTDRFLYNDDEDAENATRNTVAQALDKLTKNISEDKRAWQSKWREEVGRQWCAMHRHHGCRNEEFSRQ